MATIHRTTLTPTKLDLLTAWLPAQPWYAGHGRTPELAKAGGFRLDDPAGEVGIEFAVVTDTADPEAVTYLVPLTYRGSALPGGELVGTMEHGVLGKRWAYEGLTDPVCVEQLAALVAGRAEPQAQSASDTADPSVVCVPLVGSAGRRLVVTVNRVLEPDEDGREHDPSAAAGRVYAGWRRADGTSVRGCFAWSEVEEDSADGGGGGAQQVGDE